MFLAFTELFILVILLYSGVHTIARSKHQSLNTTLHSSARKGSDMTVDYKTALD